MAPGRALRFGVMLLLCVATAGCGPDRARGSVADGDPADADADAAGHRRMVQRLEDLALAANPATNGFVNAERVRWMEGDPPAANPVEQFRQRGRLAHERVLAGDTERAIPELEALLREAESGGYPATILQTVRHELAVAWLRLAEEQNCVAHHDADSCLFPIRAGGQHVAQRGSREALEQYAALLQQSPGDLSARWLINLAAMTLGEHPAAVPERWRIPLTAFESEDTVPRFRDVAPAAGLDAVALSGGAAMEDLDGDGDLDVVASSWGLADPLRLFLSNGDGTFAERTVEAGLEGVRGGLNLVHADYDNDGDVDLYVLRGAWLGKDGRFPNSLLRNDGEGRFVDVTERAGLLAFHPTQTAAWADYDGDGWLDLFVGNESSGDELHRCELFRNLGDGSFEEVARESGLGLFGFVKAAVWGDVDNDGRPDLYLSRLREPNLLFRNEGPDAAGRVRFRETAAAAGVSEPLNSFPAWFWDYDNDGWLDLFVSGYMAAWNEGSIGEVAADYLGLAVRAERPRLYRNRGDGSFEDVTRAAGLWRVLLTMGCNYGDLDNDGWVDMYLGTGEPDLRALMPNRMFRNARGRAFRDVTTVGGFGHLQKGHGVAFGDVDADGDQDIFAVMGGAYEGDVYANVLFENPGNANGWVTLRLEGRRSNRGAIGARLRVVLRDGSGGTRTVHALVGSGGSFGGSTLQQEIGLGDATAVERVEIDWPGGESQRIEGIAPRAVYRIVEGESTATRVKVSSFALGGSR